MAHRIDIVLKGIYKMLFGAGQNQPMGSRTTPSLASKSKRSTAYERTKSQLTKEFKKAPKKNDIKWRQLGEEAIQHALKSNWGFYRNIRLRMAELVRKEGKSKTALLYYLWVCYLDLNGPDNAEGRQNYPDLLREYPPFNPKLAINAPGVIYHVTRIINKLSLNESEAHQIFDKVARKEYKGLKLPISPEEAWQKLRKELFAP